MLLLLIPMLCYVLVFCLTACPNVPLITVVSESVYQYTSTSIPVRYEPSMSVEFSFVSLHIPTTTRTLRAVFMYGPVPLENSACVAGVHAPAKPVCGRHVAGTVML